eukprot:GHVH01005843.1.p1 GENE.GHVH01005843.1~~GHVH01005843.1.p1  ORF type:complete len:538 (-),score=111.92 GHVH01005843.1:396-2009(-)
MSKDPSHLNDDAEGFKVPNDEDTGCQSKTSALINKFNTPKCGVNQELKERQAKKKFGDDRFHFLQKKDGEERDAVELKAPKTVDKGNSWLAKVDEAERAKKAPNHQGWKNEKVLHLEAELSSASKECSERSRLLTETREKYSILKYQFTELQVLLGLAKSSRHAEYRSQKVAEETEKERNKRECEENDALQTQVLEMKAKLSDIMAAEIEKESLKAELKQCEDVIESQKLELDNSIRKVSNATDALGAINVSVEDLKSANLESERQLNAKIDGLNTTIAHKDSCITKLKEDCKTFQDQERSLEAALESISGELTSKEEEVNRLTCELGVLQDLVKELEVTLEATSDRTVVLQSVELDLQNQLTSMRQRHGELVARTEELANLEEAYQTEQGKCRAMEIELKENREEHAKLISDLSILRESIDGHKNDVGMVDTDPMLQNTIISELKSCLEVVRGDLVKVEEEKRKNIFKLVNKLKEQEKSLALKDEALISIRGSLNILERLSAVSIHDKHRFIYCLSASTQRSGKFSISEYWIISLA